MSRTGYERQARLAAADEAAALVNRGLRRREVAARMGIKRSTLSNLLRLRKLADSLRPLLAAELLPLNVAYRLIALDAEMQVVAWERIEASLNRGVALRLHLGEVAHG